jgi:hypothetical protein
MESSTLRSVEDVRAVIMFGNDRRLLSSSHLKQEVLESPHEGELSLDVHVRCRIPFNGVLGSTFGCCSCRGVVEAVSLVRRLQALLAERGS